MEVPFSKPVGDLINPTASRKVVEIGNPSRPRCSGVDKITDWLGEWNFHRIEHGSGLADDHLRVMLVNLLPESVAAEIRRRPELVTLTATMDYLWSESARMNDGRLAGVHSQRLKNMVGSKGMVHQLVDTRQDSAHDEHVPDRMEALEKQCQELLAAVRTQPPPRPHAAARPGTKFNGGGASPVWPRSNSPGGGRRSNLKRPDPSFKGCWHCGKEDHVRTKCPMFMKMIKDNKNKVPDGYQGLVEKAMAKKDATGVNALTRVLPTTALFDDEEGSEWSETERTHMQFGLLPTTSPDFTHHNVFSALKSDDGDDGEAEELRVAMACAQLTRNVRVGLKVPQSQRRPVRPKPLGHQKIREICAAMKCGHPNFNDIDQEVTTDDDLVAVWALVDSGSGVHIASHGTHFPGARLQKGDRHGAKYTAANGSEMEDEGAMTITALTEEGAQASIVFQSNSQVGMPILSVAKLGLQHDAFFRETDGELVHRASGQRTKFVKRAGVYFLRLMVKKSVASPLAENRCPFGRQAP